VAQAKRILEALKQLGTTHIVSLPDNIARALLEAGEADPDLQMVPVCREGEAMALAAGLYIGGKQPVVVIQCTGFLEAGDALRGTLWAMKIPVLLLLGYRGYRTLAGPQKDSAAVFFEPTLRAWDIPYDLLGSDEDIPKIASCWQLAQERSRPVALLLTEECY
jgi:sulfopyruvate decarboxylase TPP-binding subunit